MIILEIEYADLVLYRPGEDIIFMGVSTSENDISRLTGKKHKGRVSIGEDSREYECSIFLRVEEGESLKYATTLGISPVKYNTIDKIKRLVGVSAIIQENIGGCE